MPGVVRRPLALASLAVAIVAAACSGSSDPGPTTAPTGPVASTDADRAVSALCELAGETDPAAANALFQDRAHQTLHAVAAEAERVDRAASAALLETKQRVEADLAEPDLPPGFADDVETLLVALRAALETIGLPAPECGR
jgi:hypothetical protein